MPFDTPSFGFTALDTPNDNLPPPLTADSFFLIMQIADHVRCCRTPRPMLSHPLLTGVSVMALLAPAFPTKCSPVTSSRFFVACVPRLFFPSSTRCPLLFRRRPAPGPGCQFENDFIQYQLTEGLNMRFLVGGGGRLGVGVGRWVVATSQLMEIVFCRCTATVSSACRRMMSTVVLCL